MYKISSTIVDARKDTVNLSGYIIVTYFIKVKYVLWPISSHMVLTCKILYIYYMMVSYHNTANF